MNTLMKLLLAIGSIAWIWIALDDWIKKDYVRNEANLTRAVVFFVGFIVIKGLEKRKD